MTIQERVALAGLLMALAPHGVTQAFPEPRPEPKPDPFTEDRIKKAQEKRDRKATKRIKQERAK